MFPACDRRDEKCQRKALSNSKINPHYNGRCIVSLVRSCHAVKDQHVSTRHTDMKAQFLFIHGSTVGQMLGGVQYFSLFSLLFTIPFTVLFTPDQSSQSTEIAQRIHKVYY